MPIFCANINDIVVSFTHVPKCGGTSVKTMMLDAEGLDWRNEVSVDWGIPENQRTYKGEKLADIKIEGGKKLKAINCPTNLNSGAIDEFLIIFLVAAKAKGISYFKDLAELNQKESPRLKWGAKILNMMGVKNIVTNSSIKIYGNPNLEIRKKIIIKNYLKDHRVFMTSVIASLSFGGEWHIYDKDSIKTSFPNFLKIIDELKN